MAKSKALIPTVISTVLWVLSIVLAFVIKPGSAMAFVPDALLLLGFFPLLVLWRQGWLTFLFGLFNTLIGFFLLILQYMDDAPFVGSMKMMREHLITMHSCWTWIVLGIVPLIWGLVSMILSLSRWIMRRARAESKD
ncbi:MAG: hypothetical protein JSS83_15380 [Cyanobacteria bacterium SZAS LIN-3]|nr:hypothetical protein [Cyanobacteria bacterium SZAS LIN-3]